MGAYAIAKYVDGPFMPWIGFVFLMGHMSINHLHRQFVNAPDKVDITGQLASVYIIISVLTYNLQEHRWYWS